MAALDVLILEPIDRGSHRAWGEGLAAASRHRIRRLCLPEMGWREAVAAGPLLFASMIDEDVTAHGAPDLVVASSPMDLAAVLGLARRQLGDLAVLLYLHESQAAFPPGPAGGSATPQVTADTRSVAAADRVIVASEHHRMTVREGLASGGSGLDPEIEVIGVGVDTAQLRPPAVRRPGPPRVLWNHRWEHDKDPDAAVHALSVLAGDGVEFELILLGAVHRSGRRARDRALRTLGDRVVCHGEVPRDDYVEQLADADIVVSTARHEFFGIAVIEAVAAGCRPVVPDHLSYPEIVSDDRDRYDAGELLDALRVALDDVVTGAVSPAALAASVQRFSWGRLAERYDRAFESVHRAHTVDG